MGMSEEQLLAALAGGSRSMEPSGRGAMMPAYGLMPTIMTYMSSRPYEGDPAKEQRKISKNRMMNDLLKEEREAQRKEQSEIRKTLLNIASDLALADDPMTGGTSAERAANYFNALMKAWNAEMGGGKKEKK